MKRAIVLLAIFMCTTINSIWAQNNEQCSHCRMAIQDELHKAEAIDVNATTLYFGSIECLVNYLKDKKEINFKSLKVSDYNSANLIDAKSAYYLISSSIPSPMGANLSAFASKSAAKTKVNSEEDKVYNWTELLAAFSNAKFGAVDAHHRHNHFRSDSHAPIGVMGDHLHAKGGVMVSFRYMNMQMKDNKAGTNTISNQEIFTQFMVAPQEMTMDMYMLGIMYAPTNKLTLMAMQNVVSKNMDLTAQMMMDGNTMLRNFSTSSSGLGDLKLGALYGIVNHHNSSFHLNGVISFPIGVIDNTDDTPMMTNAKLPYAMQLGSGTWDFTFGGTYKGSTQNLSWGSQLLGTFRTGTNSEEYRFGNRYQLNLWGAYRITDGFSLSARLLGELEDDITGMDPQLNPMMVTTADTENYGGNMLKTFVGANVAFPESSPFNKLRFGVEAGLPVYEDYNGIQMDENLTINLGLKYEVL